MKVLHIIGDLQIGGVQLDLYKHLKVAVSSEYTPEVLSLSGPGPVGQRITGLGIPVHSLNFSRFNAVRSFRDLVVLIGRIRPDVINAQMYHAILLVTVALLFRRKIPVTWGIYHNSFRREWNKSSTLAVMKGCAVASHFFPFRIVFPSGTSMNLHRNAGFCKDKLMVIPNGFDLPVLMSDKERTELKGTLGLPSGLPVIGMVGRYDPLKDPAGFIDAARILFQRRPDVHFAFCGPGFSKDNPELVALIWQSGISEQFHLLGERSDVLQIMQTFTLFTLSSRAESFGNVVGEAMSVGIPCAVTDVGACSRLVGDTGRVVPPESPSALSDAWDALLGLGADRLDKLGDRARQRILVDFSLSRTTKAYLELFRDAVS